MAHRDSLAENCHWASASRSIWLDHHDHDRTEIVYPVLVCGKFPDDPLQDDGVFRPGWGVQLETRIPSEEAVQVLPEPGGAGLLACIVLLVFLRKVFPR